MPKNPTQPETLLKVAGEEYRLLFDFEAIAEAEEITGMSLISGLQQKDVRAPRIAFVRAMLFACLRKSQPAITRSEASALVTLRNWSEVWTAVIEAWAAAMAKPDLEDGAADPPKGQS